MRSFFEEAAVTFYDADAQERKGTASRVKDQAGKERRQITDALGRVIRVDEPTSSGLGAANAPNQPTHYYYDGNDNLSKTVQVEGSNRQTIGTQTYSLEYGYNLAGQLTSEKYPSGKVVSMAYDAKGRLASIADTQRTYLSGLQYQGKGNSVNSMTLGNGTAQSFVMNDRLQMESQELKRGTEILQKYDYGYGQIDTETGVIAANSNNGQLAKIESTIGASKQWEQRFGYDSVGRLSEAREHRGDTNALSYKQKFDYDRFGNLYRKASSNPTTGQATPIAFAPIEETDISKTTNRFTTGTTYDDAGNVTQDAKFRLLNYSYDANGRMYKTTTISPANQSNAGYDASGNRVATQVDGVWTFFIFDAFGKKVAEYGGLQATDEGGVKYVLQDWQGSSRAIVSNSGYVNARMDYTAFGEEIQSNIGQRTAQGYAASNTLDQKYALTERDKATGLDHTWFRKLENQAGRWTSPDPYNGSMNLGSPQSFNRYSYVENQPTNFVDPSGLQLVEYTCYDINTYWSQGQFSSGVMTTTRCFYRVLPSEGGGGPWDVDAGGGAPSEPTDCEKFADEVDQLAAAATSASDFISKLWDAFANLDIHKSTSGFKSGFTDEVGPGNSANQVRHTTGAIYAGYVGGVAYWTGRVATFPAGVIANAVGASSVALAATLDIFNERERTYGPREELGRGPRPLIPPTPSQAADMRLNGVAVPIGFQLGNGEINRNQVGNLIRGNICF